MTDIERIKKINNMAAELKKHRLATSYEDAAQQSEQIFSATPGVPQPEERIPEPVSNAIGNEQFERYKTEVNKRLATTESQLSTVIEKMNEMIATINKLESELLITEKQTEKQTTITKEETPKETVAQPRSGEYTSNDVDINKIFYFGNK